MTSLLSYVSMSPLHGFIPNLLHVPKGSNQWLVINKDASNPDEKYWLSAAVDLAILAAIIFFFIWAEKSLRRARKQRRSESAEEPVDVESGERSPQ